MMRNQAVMTSLLCLLCVYAGTAAAHANPDGAHTHTGLEDEVTLTPEGAPSEAGSCGIPSPVAASGVALGAIPPAVLKPLVGIWQGDTASLDTARLTPAEQTALADLAPVFEIAINHRAEGLFVSDLRVDGQRAQHVLPVTLAWGRPTIGQPSHPAPDSASGPVIKWGIEQGRLYVTNTQRPGEVLIFMPPDVQDAVRCINCIEYGMPTRWVRVSQ